MGICELSSPGKEGVPYKRLSGSLEDLKQYMLSVFSTISLTQQDIFSLKKGEVFKPDSPLRIPYPDLDPEWFNREILPHLRKQVKDKN